MTDHANREGRESCTGCGSCDECCDDVPSAGLDDFIREVAWQLLGPPESGTVWGGGAIVDGIRALKTERDEAKREAGETRMAIAHRNLVVLDQASHIRELREERAKLRAQIERLASGLRELYRTLPAGDHLGIVTGMMEDWSR